MKNRKKGLSKLFILLVALLVFITGCSSDNGGDNANTELVVANGADPVTFDIQATNDQATTRIARQIYDTLIKQTNDLELVPALATKWEHIGDNVYEFTLRDDVTFHNGEKFTANDVAFTLRRAKESASIGHIVGAIDPDTIEVVSDTVIRFGTFEAFGPLLTHLAHPATAILNEKAVTDAGEDYGTTVVVGTGPFKFESWTTGDRVIATRFDDYWGDAPALERIVFKTIADPSVRLIELETGAAHIAYDLSPQDLDKVRDNDDLTLLNTANLGAEYLGLNLQSDTPLKDKNVRKAIAHAINVEEIIDVIYLNVGSQMSGPINELVFGFNDALEPYAFDLDLAKDYLAQAGYPDGGFELVLQVGDNSQERILVAQVVQESLAKIGITVNVRQSEWASFLDSTGKGEGDMFLLGWTTVTTDGDYGLYPLFHSSQFGAAGNRSFYKNDEVDRLLELGRYTSNEDSDLRADYYKEVQRIVHDELPWVFLQTRENVTGISNRVKGFEHHPTGSYFLEDVSLTD